jgi:hypothetical protein
VRRRQEAELAAAEERERVAAEIAAAAARVSRLAAAELAAARAEVEAEAAVAVARAAAAEVLTVYFGTPSMFITLWFGFDYGTNPPLGTLII